MGDIRESYEAWVEGKQVVLGYRAFAEDGKPYCISVKLPDGKNLWSTFQPSTPEGYVTAEMCDDYDRRQIANWVQTLGDLIAKAYPVVVAADAFPDAYQVDRLGMDETDETWIDREDDAYRYFDDAWHISYASDFKGEATAPDDWFPINYESTLTNHGPYTVWRP